MSDPTPSAQAAEPPARIGRSIGAVALGFFLVAGLSIATDAVMHGTGVFPPMGQPMATGLWVLATAYRVVFTVGGNWVTARMAPRRPMKHAIILGCIGTAIAIVGVLATWKMGPEFGPKWYPIGLVVTALPCSWLGARLARPRAN